MKDYFSKTLRAHNEDGEILNMPVVLGEFGIPYPKFSLRHELYEIAYDLIYENAEM